MLMFTDSSIGIALCATGSTNNELAVYLVQSATAERCAMLY